MNEQRNEKVEAIKELHSDLARKYRLHGPKIEAIWRSFDQNQRAQAMKAGAADGVVLKDPLDRSMGNVYKILPELNLRDISAPGSDYLLDLLKHRATKTLHQQYCEGPHDGPGDHGFILNSMQVNNLQHASSFRYSFTTFLDEDGYGQSYKSKTLKDHNEVMQNLSVAVNAGLCVPQSTGELILERQLHTLQMLNILVEDILDGGSPATNVSHQPKKPEKVARNALSKLSIAPKPAKATLQDMLARAQEQKSSLEDYLDLCRSEPLFVAHVVNMWFFSRPELVQDEKGRSLPLHTDKYISIAMFEMIHNAITAVAIWDYLCQLLKKLDDKPNDKVYINILIQEISNVCHLEYSRIQKIFNRYVQVGSGSKCFRRVAGKYDNGVARVSMKGKPELLTRENPRLHYMLRLCQTETTPPKAIDWIKKLDDLHQSYPSEREDMFESEFESFCDLAVIAGFIQSLTTILPLPRIDPKKGQLYVSKSRELAAKIDPLKSEVDLTDFAIPIDNLKEPGMAENAFKTLDQFIVDKAGTKMGLLYQDLVENCTADIEELYQLQKEQLERKIKTEIWSISTAQTVEAPDQEDRIQQRKQKEKTRPAHSSVFDISPGPDTKTAETSAISPVFRVKKETFETFSTLFSRSDSRGSVTWAAFEAVMADLKFSVTPTSGSAYTFFPPPNSSLQLPLTVHRPHGPRIEGYMLLYFASRLSKKYGFSEQSFEVA
ncbi:hypothetical protein B0J14DRAFT_195542 [Halenospora varia]|nr:hypothetical protein B0J14DRAFT_195542 [Halenospora varia]